MEEIILKILLSQSGKFALIDVAKDNAAKQITEHVMKFIEWLKENCEAVRETEGEDMIWWIVTEDPDLLPYSNEEAYQYWNNLRK